MASRTMVPEMMTIQLPVWVASACVTGTNARRIGSYVLRSEYTTKPSADAHACCASSSAGTR